MEVGKKGDGLKNARRGNIKVDKSTHDDMMTTTTTFGDRCAK